MVKHPETNMLNAWLWEHHREHVQWRRVRLGVLPTKELARIYMTLLRWCDAIYLEDGVVHIVEAKIRPDAGAVGQLELYQDLFKNTLEFTAYREWPIQLVLLCSMPSLDLAELCSKKGIRYEIFTLEDVNRVRMQQMLPII